VASSRVRDKALTTLSAIVGTISLPAICLELQSIGPASRVVFYDYLPVEGVLTTLAAAVIGGSLGALAPRWFRRVQPLDASHRTPKLRLVALGILLAWVALGQLRAFPASANALERDAWARAHVPQYRALKRVIAAVPEVRTDVGRIVAIAPTATDQHRSAREMNGDDMFFALDVIGERGAGIFYVDCTLDEYRVYQWRSGRWVMRGRESRIESVPDHVPQARMLERRRVRADLAHRPTQTFARLST
jgi:hypothetical protein